MDQNDANPMTPDPLAIDDAVAEEMDLIVDGDVAHAPPRRRSSSVGGAMLAAAMLGIGEILEPEKTEVSMEQAGDARDPEDDLLAMFDFGELPPLN